MVLAVHYGLVSLTGIIHVAIFVSASCSFMDDFNRYKTIIKLYIHITTEIFVRQSKIMSSMIMLGSSQLLIIVMISDCF
jgi:hypothetical protein